jgi:hypothetical protein
VRFFHGKASQKKISREIFFPPAPLCCNGVAAKKNRGAAKRKKVKLSYN